MDEFIAEAFKRRSTSQDARSSRYDLKRFRENKEAGPGEMVSCRREEQQKANQTPKSAEQSLYEAVKGCISGYYGAEEPKGGGRRLRDEPSAGEPAVSVFRGCVHSPGNIKSWLLLPFCLLPLAAQGKVYERCELAAAVKRLGPNNLGTQPGTLAVVIRKLFPGAACLITPPQFLTAPLLLAAVPSSAGHLPAVAGQLERGRQVKLRSKQEWERRARQAAGQRHCYGTQRQGVVGQRQQTIVKPISFGGKRTWALIPESRISETSSQWWCNGGRTPRAKHVCNIPCS
ncbi:PREDICTED: uncharacterized protein LOC104076660, partial [Fulmarus glacialis]|uniref:uncharacterized protein LOC104076660 n=1 Tax=Fulmarus glacialis TaxID=30455 RepID=UPI00051C3854